MGKEWAGGDYLQAVGRPDKHECHLRACDNIRACVCAKYWQKAGGSAR